MSRERLPEFIAGAQLSSAQAMISAWKAVAGPETEAGAQLERAIIHMQVALNDLRDAHASLSKRRERAA